MTEAFLPAYMIFAYFPMTKAFLPAYMTFAGVFTCGVLINKKIS